jgi:rhodanese-related sulfurtransferase
MSNLNEIAFFQFDNLIRNRIPFVMLNLTTQTPAIYTSRLYQQHLETIELKTDLNKAIDQLKERRHPQHEAILVLCEDGIQSQSLVETLEKEGYLNVYFVKDGVKTLLADASRR